MKGHLVGSSGWPSFAWLGFYAVPELPLKEDGAGGSKKQRLEAGL